MYAMLSPEQKAQYKKTFEQWFFTATEEEIDQLDAALKQYESTQVRTLVSFIRQCLADNQRSMLIPPSLVEQLKAHDLPLAAAA